jgi:hypothetical protein
MPVLPDLGAAALFAAVVFLVTLGILVVFLERGPGRRAGFVVAVTVALAAAFSLAGEVGLAFVAVAVGGAVLANRAFEWLTTR